MLSLRMRLQYWFGLRYTVRMTTLKTSKSVLVWTSVIAILVLAASLYGLFDPSIYSKETLNWATQAKGQDIGNLFAVIALLVSGYFYSKGSFKAAMVWLGTLSYLIYAYIIYAMAVHFNALFLVYVAVLGLCVYAVVFNLGRIMSHKALYPVASRKFAARSLIAFGVLFALLWMSEVIPALFAGHAPQSTLDAGLWVNPIHVMDLSVVLPAFILTGVHALNGKRTGLFLLTPWLTFSAIMGLSIVAAMLMIGGDGFAKTIPPMIIVSAVVVVSCLALWRYLRKTA